MSAPKKIKADFPEKLQFLFKPKRYKVARGGRSGSKSWGFARALLLLGVKHPLRILCAREVQKSIKDSVHKLLSDQIKLLGLEGFYTPFETTIKGINGTEILFTGLLQHTIYSIKSFEGIDICWVEEAQVVSKKSWDILIPTIRKNGSEIWISYNPELETDETHQRFTLNPPDNCENIEINWRDNPWFNEVSNQERLHCQRTDPDNYDNIWEGKCLPAVAGAIYYKEIAQMEEEGRIGEVPYDPLLRTHIVCDIGFNDDTTIGFFQKLASEYRLVDYIEGHQRDWPSYSDEMKEKRYNWGKLWLPHDGFAKRIESRGESSADILKRLGWDVVPKELILANEIGVEEGIKLTRTNFRRLYINKNNCMAFIQHTKRYRRHENQQTGAMGQPVHDDHCHAPDMLRYFMVNAKSMTNSDGAVDVSVYKPPNISAYSL